MNTMKTVLYGAAALFLLCAGCQKENTSENLSTSVSSSSGFVQYVIPRGEHYATSNNYKTGDAGELKFTVRFDSSCIYKTTLPENQLDINKLYGFSDNNATHHQFSARFGWRWSDGALRLFAYTYNNGIRNEKEVSAIPIGAEVQCAIRIINNSYLFMVNKTSVTMPRESTTPTAKGYLLYPYFGGDEAAPHEVRIWIKEEK